MKTTMQFGWLVCSLALVVSIPAFAKDKVKEGKSAPGEHQPAAKPDKKSPGGDGKEAATSDKIVISSSEREIIQSYVAERSTPAKPGKKPKGLPPGLAKKLDRGGSLPPGWEKKCVVGEIMPPEIFKVCNPLPRAITVKLPPPPPDTILVAVEGRVARLMKATHEILDVFELPLPPLPPLPKLP